MRKLSIVMCLGALWLAACGGDSSSITQEGTTIAVTTSSATVAPDGSTVTITATATNAAGAAESGVIVAFSATAGKVTLVQGSTNASGVATATLAAGGVAAGTNITVTATSQGGASGYVKVAVAGSTQDTETVTLITSSPQIKSAVGSTPATITASVVNASHQFVSGVAVDFSASSGGLAIVQGTTDANGTATATLSAASDPTNRVITVTATAGGSTATVPVDVIGTSLTVTGPASLVQGAQGTYTVALVDSGGTGIAYQAVTLSSAKGNTLSAASVTTGANGQVTFTVTAAVAGSDTITATALGQQATASLTVSNQSFSFTAPTASANVPIGTPTTVTVHWTAGGTPQVGQVVNLSATRGALSAATATIGASGTASVTISSTTAGPAVISATGTGVTAQVAVEFIATVASALNLQASPSTIDTQAESSITATVTDPNGNLVEGKVIDFTLTDVTGGSLSVGASTTDAQGQATTVYTASSTTSTLNGVQIQATVAGTGVTGSTTLTVAGETVFLSLGTGNTITAYSSTQYELPYTVQAVDAAGNGVNKIAVTFSVQSVAFIQGKSTFPTGATSWQRQSSTSATDPDAYEASAACKPGFEIINGISTAVPGSVVSTDVATATTANGGTATVNLIYPKDHSLWVAVQLTATATVTGTQSSTSATFYLPGLASDFSSASVDPPGLDSPYGFQATCLVPNSD